MTRKQPVLFRSSTTAPWLCAFVLTACGAPAAPPESPPSSTETAPPAASTAAPATSPLPPPQPLGDGIACAQATCFGFASDSAALEALVAQAQPLVIGLGEAHTPAGFQGRSTVRRFAEDLLPSLAPRSSGLIVELLAPPAGCEPAREAVQHEAQAVTTGQADTNQSEYTKLGLRARELGLVPDILRASCDDLKAIQAAGEESVVTMMETIARLTGQALEARRQKAPAARPLLLAYGGALHNDAIPRAGRETWSYGPALLRSTDGHYLELDLILPALVGDSPTWQTFAWYEAYQTVKDKNETSWLIRTSANGYALILAKDR